jgi:hypothetical protein
VSEKTRADGSAETRLRSERRISKEGRAALAKSGSANLQAYRDRVAKSPGLPTNLQAKLDNFEREVRADLGDNLTAAETCLLDSAKCSYGVILLAERQLALAPGRLAHAKGLSASLAAHQNSLLRALKVLGLKRRAAKSESLDDYLSNRTRAQ